VTTKGVFELSRNIGWVVGLTAAGFFPLSLAQAEDGVRVGVIDVAKVFGDYQMTSDLESVFDGEQKKVGEQRDARRKDLETQRKALEAFVPGTPDHKERYEQMVRADVEFQVWLGMQDRFLKDEHMRRLRQIYEDVRLAVKAVADKRGLELVLTFDQLTTEAPDSVALRQQILLQKVIYFSDRIDVTTEVLQTVNESYLKKGGAESLKLGSAQEPQKADPVQSAEAPVDAKPKS